MLNVFLLIAVSNIWGITYALSKIAIEDIPSPSLAALRLIIASMIFFMYIPIYSMKKPNFKEFRFLVIVGFCGSTLPFVLIGWGVENIDSGITAIIMATMPIWTLLLSNLMIDERLTGQRIIGIGIGFLGIFVLFSDSISNMGLPVLLILLASMSYAVGTVYSKLLFSSYTPLIIAAVSTIIGTVIAVFLALIVDYKWLSTIGVLRWTWQDFASEYFLVAILLGIFPTAIGAMIFFCLVKRAGVILASQCNYIIPLFSIFWGWIFFNEEIGIRVILSLFMVSFGIFITQDKRLISSYLKFRS